MSRNTQIEILARVVALMLADGDTDKADEILSWASDTPRAVAEKKPKDWTPSFTKKYLTPYAPYNNEKVERFILRAIVNKPLHVDQDRVKKTIENMPYSDFLNTIYWRGVSLFVKRRDGWRCSECGSTKKIKVHHKTYDNHGAETMHLEDLTTLCDKCHKKAHNLIEREKEEKAQAPTPEIRVRTRRRPRTGSALSISDIAKEMEIEKGWYQLIARYSNRPRLLKTIEKSYVTIEPPEDGKDIIVFTVSNSDQVRWVEERLLRDMESNFKEIIGREDIELRVKVRPS